MDAKPPSQEAIDAARAWLHSYGIHTERYTTQGGDHPAMMTLPLAFEAYASRADARKEKVEFLKSLLPDPVSP